MRSWAFRDGAPAGEDVHAGRPLLSVGVQGQVGLGYHHDPADPRIRDEEGMGHDCGLGRDRSPEHKGFEEVPISEVLRGAVPVVGYQMPSECFHRKPPIIPVPDRPA